jgi:hypothetical protein
MGLLVLPLLLVGLNVLAAGRVARVATERRMAGAHWSWSLALLVAPVAGPALLWLLASTMDTRSDPNTPDHLGGFFPGLLKVLALLCGGTGLVAITLVWLSTHIELRVRTRRTAQQSRQRAKTEQSPLIG